jgi:DnaJ-class molecular chaperone
VPQTKTLEVKIRPGAAVGETLVFDEVCSDHGDYDKPGDVHIRLMPFEEEIDLVRDGTALRHSTVIGLTESLLGCKRKVRSHPAHTEGLEVDIHAGTQNGEVLCVKGKGMPSAATDFGDLFIKVEVRVSEAERKTLETHKVLLQSMFGSGTMPSA